MFRANEQYGNGYIDDMENDVFFNYDGDTMDNESWFSFIGKKKKQILLSIVLVVVICACGVGVMCGYVISLMKK